jgi:hypothetical protein
MNFKRKKQMLLWQIAGHLSWAPFEVTCWNIYYAVTFPWSLENATKPRKERKQEDVCQKDKASFNLPGHWASELGTIEANILKWRAL